jgi:anaerobic selenocysteine-containing dehydrogenase
MNHPARIEQTTVRAACPHDCPDICAMVITVENGTAVKVAGASDQPFTAGTLCTKVAHYLERTYSGERVSVKARGGEGRGPVRAHWLG